MSQPNLIDTGVLFVSDVHELEEFSANCDWLILEGASPALVKLLKMRAGAKMDIVTLSECMVEMLGIGFELRDIAKLSGVNIAKLKQLVGVYGLSDTVKDAIREGSIKPSLAWKIARMSTENKIEVGKKVLETGTFTQRDLRELKQVAKTDAAKSLLPLLKNDPQMEARIALESFIGRCNALGLDDAKIAELFDGRVRRIPVAQKISVVTRIPQSESTRRAFIHPAHKRVTQTVGQTRPKGSYEYS